METHEFLAQVNPDGTLQVPAEVARRLPAGQAVRVVVLLGGLSEEEDWRRLTMEQFLAGYSDGDAIYDKLSAG